MTERPDQGHSPEAGRSRFVAGSWPNRPHRFRGLLAAATIGLIIAASATSGSEQRSQPSAWRTYQSADGELAASFPAQWHPAPRRLVRWLVDPREVLSLGTGPLRIGAGGNCGRYPAAALVRMRARDRMISIQRSTPRAGTRPRWFRHLDRWPERFRLPPPEPFDISEHGGGPTRRLWTVRLDLRLGGRHYWVFTAFGSRPSRGAQRQVERILETVRFDPS